ncbi:MAG: TRAP transporter small permease [Firmicutes bacterium]|nr:TRAP transporter small permease [Bacillota bacterium]
MEKANSIINRISRILDVMAGIALFSVMALVVANVLLRALFRSPILGTFELVCFLTAIGIGLALASCAVQNGHIAVDLLVNRFPCRAQGVIDSLTNGAALVFWMVVAWFIAEQARIMSASGEVSSTTQLPLSPVVYLISLGIFVLGLVLLFKTIESLKKAVG